jgi:hypothetical protein
LTVSASFQDRQPVQISNSLAAPDHFRCPLRVIRVVLTVPVHFRSSPTSGLSQGRSACLKGAKIRIASVSRFIWKRDADVRPPHFRPGADGYAGLTFRLA